MKNIKLGLREFLKDIYKIDIEEVCNYDNFCFDSSFIEVEEEELEKAKNIIIEEGLNIDNDLIIDLIVKSKMLAYEESYMDEYYEKYISQLEDKIIEDFEKIQEFFIDELKENNIKGSFKVEIDFKEDTINFIGDLDILEFIIVEVINSYGSFFYNSLDEFKNSTYDDIQRRVDSHIHWLQYVENIYGTIYNFFEFNSEYVDYYGTLGTCEFIEEIFIDELNWSY